MKAGIIGAGKVGFSLGKYFTENGAEVTGYYDVSEEAAREAAEFTKTRFYGSLEDITEDSDTLFVTVTDGAIEKVWKEIGNLPIKDKIICHCSGSIPSTAFFNARELGAYAYSIHPIYAVSDKYESWKGLSAACFSIEGSPERLDEMKSIFESFGNKVVPIETEKKILYHAAAAIVSNHMAALADIGTELMMACGFNEEDAIKALGPLITGNAQKVAQVGAVKAMTGPVERGDTITIRKHRKALAEYDEELEEIYRGLSVRLTEMAIKKHPEKDFKEMEEELKK